jgi:hypothetical protein
MASGFTPWQASVREDRFPNLAKESASFHRRTHSSEPRLMEQEALTKTFGVRSDRQSELREQFFEQVRSRLR